MARCACTPPARVPSDAESGFEARLEGGQIARPIRPAAGVGPWRFLSVRSTPIASSQRPGHSIALEKSRRLGRRLRAMDRRAAHRKRTDRGSTPYTPTRRRADRPIALATFHAGLEASSRVRRDARDRPQRCSSLERVNQTGSARKMPRLGPDRTRASIGAGRRGPSVHHTR